MPTNALLRARWLQKKARLELHANRLEELIEELGEKLA